MKYVTSFTNTSFSILIEEAFMHTRQELIKGYETEIRYQRHMLETWVAGLVCSFSWPVLVDC